MSDEFIKVATQEIKDEIASIKKILETCKDDSDISKNSKSIEKHLHKIKGLAPMMGKKGLGEVAALNDKLLNHVIEGQNISGIYSILGESYVFMDKSIHGTDNISQDIKQKIATNYSKYLD
jgi:HPt (histidine-containing phosphotransfer) domain-containing protein